MVLTLGITYTEMLFLEIGGLLFALYLYTFSIAGKGTIERLEVCSLPTDAPSCENHTDTGQLQLQAKIPLVT